MLNSLPPEVLSAICHALGPSTQVFRPHRRERLKTLASLARTSRLLHEPAVSAIWHTISHISVLLHTLPQDLWMESATTASDPEDEGYTVTSFQMRLSCKRQTSQSDFARLKHYAHRIEHITPANTSLIASDVLDALAIHFPAGTLLPNIHTLSYTSTPSEKYRWLPLLIGPKLRSLRLVGPAPSQVDAEHPNAGPLDCLRVLSPRICPVLSELTTRMDLETNIPHINVISEVIRGFQDLTTVLVPGIPLDFLAIMHLARLRNLNTLHANPSEEIKQVDYQYLTSTSASGQVYFPNLRKINLKDRFLAFCTSLLKVVSSPVLDAVTFTTTQVFGFCCTSEDVSELCVELGRHTSLTSITVTVNSMLTGEHLNRKTFAPLLVLSNLSVLYMNITHTVDIDNAFLADMAHAWRKITQLELCVENPFWDMAFYHPVATLHGLVPFARLCPELEVLGIPVDADVSRIRRASLERRPVYSKSGLCFLKVGLSVVRDPVPVAAFLSDVFPALTGVSSAWVDSMGEDMSEDMDGDIGTPEEIGARWDEVVRLMRRFRHVRGQERVWAAAHGKSQSVAGTYSIHWSGVLQAASRHYCLLPRS
ncbi:hypothetical protein LXA43DRAFT_979478 [Ganoderma leucocontextum]|nr:hypothetical protein LXA43DRAFT_979478 [Ganoderma leucocontextum]